MAGAQSPPSRSDLGMSGGAHTLLIAADTLTPPLVWRERFLRCCRDRTVTLLPDDAIDPASVRYAAVWKPQPGALSAFPNLAVIFNLGAGVDGLMGDPTLPLRSTTARCRRLRSMCLQPSRCPRRARCGPIRRSRSHRTTPPRSTPTPFRCTWRSRSHASSAARH